METTWRELVQRYAMRAREFSDMVATLGLDVHAKPEECRGRLDTIRGKLDICVAAADEIELLLNAKAEAAEA
jgi:hypothetical protein